MSFGKAIRFARKKSNSALTSNSNSNSNSSSDSFLVVSSDLKIDQSTNKDEDGRYIPSSIGSTRTSPSLIPIKNNVNQDQHPNHSISPTQTSDHDPRVWGVKKNRPIDQDYDDRIGRDHQGRRPIGSSSLNVGETFRTHSGLGIQLSSSPDRLEPVRAPWISTDPSENNPQRSSASQTINPGQLPTPPSSPPVPRIGFRSNPHPLSPASLSAFDQDRYRHGPRPERARVRPDSWLLKPNEAHKALSSASSSASSPPSTLGVSLSSPPIEQPFVLIVGQDTRVDHENSLSSLESPNSRNPDPNDDKKPHPLPRSTTTTTTTIHNSNTFQARVLLNHQNADRKVSNSSYSLMDAFFGNKKPVPAIDTALKTPELILSPSPTLSPSTIASPEPSCGPKEEPRLADSPVKGVEVGSEDQSPGEGDGTEDDEVDPSSSSSSTPSSEDQDSTGPTDSEPQSSRRGDGGADSYGDDDGPQKSEELREAPSEIQAEEEGGEENDRVLDPLAAPIVENDSDEDIPPSPATDSISPPPHSNQSPIAKTADQSDSLTQKSEMSSPSTSSPSSLTRGGDCSGSQKDKRLSTSSKSSSYSSSSENSARTFSTTPDVQYPLKPSEPGKERSTSMIERGVSAEKPKSSCSSSDSDRPSSSPSEKSARKRPIEKIYISEEVEPGLGSGCQQVGDEEDGKAESIYEDGLEEAEGKENEKGIEKVIVNGEKSDDTEVESSKNFKGGDKQELESVEKVIVRKKRPLRFEKFMITNDRIFRKILNALNYQDYRSLFKSFNEPTRFILESNYYRFRSIILERFLGRFGYRTLIDYSSFNDNARRVQGGGGGVKEKENKKNNEKSSEKVPEIDLRDLDSIYFGDQNFGINEDSNLIEYCKKIGLGSSSGMNGNQDHQTEPGKKRGMGSSLSIMNPNRLRMIKLIKDYLRSYNKLVAYLRIMYERGIGFDPHNNQRRRKNETTLMDSNRERLIRKIKSSNSIMINRRLVLGSGSGSGFEDEDGGEVEKFEDEKGLGIIGCEEEFLEVFKSGRAACFKVWVTCQDYWMNNQELVECERELWRSGIWCNLRRGDLCWNLGIGDFSNEGRLIFDGSYCRDLGFEVDEIGHLPSWLNMMNFPVSYYHKLIFNSDPTQMIVYLNLNRFREEITRNLRLIKDQVEMNSILSRYKIQKWIYRTEFRIERRDCISQEEEEQEQRRRREDEGLKNDKRNHSTVVGLGGGGRVKNVDFNNNNNKKSSSFTKDLNKKDKIDLSWVGTCFIEIESTSEKVKEVMNKIGSVNKLSPWRIVREKSGPGRLCLKPVYDEEKIGGSSF